MLLERASVLLQSPNPNEASGAGFRMHNGSTRLMVVPHLRTKTRAVHPSTLCVWEEKKTPIPPTCHNGNGSEHAFVGRSDPHLDLFGPPSVFRRQFATVAVPSITGRGLFFFHSFALKQMLCDSASRLQRQAAPMGSENGWMRVRYTGAYFRYSSDADKQLPN